VRFNCRSKPLKDDDSPSAASLSLSVCFLSREKLLLTVSRESEDPRLEGEAIPLSTSKAVLYSEGTELPTEVMLPCLPASTNVLPARLDAEEFFSGFSGNGGAGLLPARLEAEEFLSSFSGKGGAGLLEDKGRRTWRWAGEGAAA